MSVAAILFYALGALALGSAIAMLLFVRNLVAGALCLLVTMISLAGIYVLLGAHFVAAIQIIVYAGAVMILFLFVIMLLDLREDSFAPALAGQLLVKALGIGLALAGLALLLEWLPSLPAFPSVADGFGGFRQLGIALYTEFVVPLEVAGLLLLAAVVGAVVLAKRGGVE